MDRDTKYCTECGQELASDAAFCGQCGSPTSNTEAAVGTDGTAKNASDDQESGSGFTRRQLVVGGVGGLAVGGAGVFALGRLGEPEFEQARDPWSNERRDEGQTSVEVQVDLTLPEGRWAVRDYQVQVGTELDYRLDVQNGNPAEVFVIDRREFDRFREGDEITHYVDFHGTGTTPHASGGLSAGDYLIIIDNTAYGDISPEGEVRGELVMQAGL